MKNVTDSFLSVGY
jgi:hypothetical protein